MSPLGRIVDMVRLDLEFVEDYPKTRIFQSVGKPFCVWILEVSKSVRTCIAIRYTTTRNSLGHVQGHTSYTKFSVIFWK